MLIFIIACPIVAHKMIHEEFFREKGRFYGLFDLLSFMDREIWIKVTRRDQNLFLDSNLTLRKSQ